MAEEKPSERNDDVLKKPYSEIEDSNEKERYIKAAKKAIGSGENPFVGRQSQEDWEALQKEDTFKSKGLLSKGKERNISALNKILGTEKVSSVFFANRNSKIIDQMESYLKIVREMLQFERMQETIDQRSKSRSKPPNYIPRSSQQEGVSEEPPPLPPRPAKKQVFSKKGKILREQAEQRLMARMKKEKEIANEAVSKSKMMFSDRAKVIQNKKTKIDLPEILEPYREEIEKGVKTGNFKVKEDFTAEGKEDIKALGAFLVKMGDKIKSVDFSGSTFEDIGDLRVLLHQKSLKEIDFSDVTIESSSRYNPRSIITSVISKSDNLEDLTLSDAWKTYRQSLRDIPANYTDEAAYDLLLARDDSGNLTHSVWSKP